MAKVSEPKEGKVIGAKDNRPFILKAGTIFVAVLIFALWLANLPRQFQGDLSLTGKPTSASTTDFAAVRHDLDRILQDVGNRFEKMADSQDKNSEEAELLLNKINSAASSTVFASGTDLIATTSSISSSSTRALKK